MSENIVNFPQNPGEVHLEVARRNHDRPCPHRRPALHSALPGGGRYAWCRDCKAIIDPLDLLFKYAKADHSLRKRHRGWQDLEEAWRWLLEQDGRLSISAKGGVRVSVVRNGKRISRNSPWTIGADTLACRIVAAISRCLPWHAKGRPDWAKTAPPGT